MWNRTTMRLFEVISPLRVYGIPFRSGFQYIQNRGIGQVFEAAFKLILDLQTRNIGLLPFMVAAPPLSAIGDPSALQQAAP